MFRLPRIRSLRWRFLAISNLILILLLVVNRSQAIYVMSLRNMAVIDRDLEIKINALLNDNAPKISVPMTPKLDSVINDADMHVPDLAAIHKEGGQLESLFDFNWAVIDYYKDRIDDRTVVARVRSDGSIAESKEWNLNIIQHDAGPLIINTTSDGWVRYAAVRLVDGGSLYVSKSLSEYYRDLNTRFAANVVGSFFVFAFTQPVWWFLITRSLKSYDAITATAGMIVKNNRDARIDVAQVDTEMSEMATNLNAMLDHVNELHDAQAQFLADASHELRTPLAGIMNNAQMALMQPNNTEELRRALAYCQASATRMSRLVNELLDLTRSEGRVDRPHRKVFIDALIADAVEQVEPMAQWRTITLEEKIEQSGLMVLGDSGELYQVLVNLLTNAIQHSEAGGVVCIGAKGYSLNSIRHVMLWVSDMGAGIDPAIGSRVFQRFLRGANKVEGTGLGLAICKSIVHAHGGVIKYRPNEPKGTIFEVSLEATTTTTDYHLA